MSSPNTTTYDVIGECRAKQGAHVMVNTLGNAEGITPLFKVIFRDEDIADEIYCTPIRIIVYPRLTWKEDKFVCAKAEDCTLEALTDEELADVVESKTLRTSESHRPMPHVIYGNEWERGEDPFHKDAFPDPLKDLAPSQTNPRGQGWLLQDAWGNDIGYVPDDTEIRFCKEMP